MRVRGPWRLCAWCVVAVLVELGLYASYRGHDARFHWFTHAFVGAAAALAVMTVVVVVRRRPVARPLLWPMIAHVFAMTPDLLFSGGYVHRWWMNLFLGHIRVHFVPGRNWTWLVVFLAALAAYLIAVDRVRPARPQRERLDALQPPVGNDEPRTGDAAHGRARARASRDR